MSDSGNAPYTAPYTTDRGAQLLIIAIISLALTLLSVYLRIQTTYNGPRSAFALYKDDILCFAAAVCSR
jgi:hypothetical protein